MRRDNTTPCHDPACPCRDGDPCHYEDTAATKAWPRHEPNLMRQITRRILTPLTVWVQCRTRGHDWSHVWTTPRGELAYECRRCKCLAVTRRD